MLNFYDEDGKIQFDKDWQVVKQYFFQYVNQNMVFFYNLWEKFDYFVIEGYYECEVLDQYLFNFVCDLFDEVYVWKFCFLMFFGVFKYYMFYMLKMFDGKCYLECYEDCVCMVVLMFVCGNEQFVCDFMDEIIFGCFQLVILIFFNVGK